MKINDWSTGFKKLYLKVTLCFDTHVLHNYSKEYYIKESSNVCGFACENIKNHCTRIVLFSRQPINTFIRNSVIVLLFNGRVGGNLFFQMGCGY